MAIFKKTPGQEEETGKTVARYVRDEYLQAISVYSEQRESSRRMWDLVSGDIPDAATREKLNKKGLLSIPLNIILPKIIRIMGAERQTRTGIKAVPLRRGSNETSKAYSKLFEKVRVDSDGHREILKAWIDSVVTNLPGWIEIVWTNDFDPLGTPQYSAVNNFYVMWDPKSQRADLRDARWVMKSWWARKNELLSDFPDKVTEINDKLRNTFSKRASSFVQDAWETIRGAKESMDSQFVNRKEDLFRVIEAQLREETRETRLFDPVRKEIMTVEDKKQLKKLKEQFPRLIEIDFKQDKIRVVTTVMGDTLVLQEEDAEVQNGMFSLIPIWGFRFGGKTMGIVKNLEGPQEVVWKEFSSALHITNTIANPIWMIPKDSVDEQGKRDLEDFGARTGYVLEYDTVDGQRPHRDYSTVPVVGKLSLADRASNLADIISGIGPNAVGRADTASESGKLVQTRVGETMAMLETFFDNKMKATIMIHYYLIALIQAKMPAFRILKWTSDEGLAERLVINQVTANRIKNDLKDGDYGIAVEKAEAQFFRQEKFVKLLLLAKTVGLNPELAEMLIDTFDEVNDSEKERLKKSYRMNALEPQLAQREQELRAQAKDRSESNLRKEDAQVKQIAQLSKG